MVKPQLNLEKKDEIKKPDGNLVKVVTVSAFWIVFVSLAAITLVYCTCILLREEHKIARLTCLYRLGPNDRPV